MAKRTLVGELRRTGKASGSTKAKFSDDDAETDDIDLDETDEDEDDDDSDDSDDDDDEDEDEDDEKLKGGGKKALDAERKARRAADRENRSLKRQLAARTEKRKTVKDDPKNERDEDEDDAPSAREIAADNKLKRAGLRSELVEAGVSSRNVRLLIGQVKLDDIDLDDDDDVEDVEDIIDELKKEFPDLFKRAKSDDEDDETPRRRRISGGDAANRRPGRRSLDSTDRIVASLVGKG